MHIIETEGLTKIYPGGVRAVDGIDFAVEEGEIFGFLGPNGAGKTTTIKMLNTLTRPTSGRATVAGLDVVRNPGKVRRNIGYVAQDVGVDEYQTGRENLSLYGHLYRLDKKTIRERVKSLFEMVELVEFADKLVLTYSGGMRKRLDIAMGLIHQPKVIFLDEPTVGLDPQTRVHIWEYIRTLASNLGITIFLTTHYMEEADQLADRVAIIDLGKIIRIGTPAELKQSVRGDVVTLSFGPGANEDFTERTEAILAGTDFVLRTEATNGELAVYVDNGETAAPAIMRLLDESNILINTISVSKPTLDDVFLKYTGRTMRTEEGKASTPHQIHHKRLKR
ncbi:MAG: ATP-binding cassette domain-containing protein [Dehalococcoidia bacterium]